MMTSILTVCTANVCRSPVIQALLVAAVGPGLPVHSAGIEAADGQPICSSAADLLGSDPRTRQMAEDHRSAPVTQELLDGAGLILCASRHQQDVIGQLSPDVRHRTFTLLQAAALTEVWVSGQPDAGLPRTLTGFTDLLHRSRWQVTARRGERRGVFGWRAPAPAGMSVSDWHTGAARTHAAVFRPIRSAVATLGPALRAVSPGCPEPGLRPQFLTSS